MWDKTKARPMPRLTSYFFFFFGAAFLAAFFFVAMYLASLKLTFSLEGLSVKWPKTVIAHQDIASALCLAQHIAVTKHECQQLSLIFLLPGTPTR